MSPSPTPSSDASADDRILETVSAWPGVAVGPHRLGTNEFTLDGREIGHTHGDRVVDVNFPKRVADRLVATGETNRHRFAGGGWTSFTIDSSDDVDRAIRLLRLSYLHTALTLRRKPAGRAVLADLDLEAELEALDVDDEIESIIVRMRS
ncbi:luciferase domain-containing protein [Natronorubrum halophilum]|uniref:luciferase domain-containing protein n=1 Tax=Natronorubrum halophilum TaxID=1702106 RepID=UPI0010C20F3D|nr:luciferase family protein [Natronorubrum halophilum]